ncbi:MAG TPA: hypothetical protein VMJ90_04575, partial [Anaerolineales bacterium]|nr:hypothetical protein [Anaerolineales bacterium]
MATHIPPAIARIAPDGNLTPRQIRRIMIDMVMRKGKPGTGSSAEFMRRRTAENPWPDLREILKSVEWAIVGVVATRAYMPERMTQAMDILVYESTGEMVIKLLEQAGYRVSSGLTTSGCLMLAPDETIVNVIFGHEVWLKKALSDPGKDPAGYPVIRLPYLVMMKMNAQRTRDMGDLGTMLGWASDADLDAVRAVVKQYAPEDLEDLESLIFIGKREQENP